MDIALKLFVGSMLGPPSRESADGLGDELAPHPMVAATMITTIAIRMPISWPHISPAVDSFAHVAHAPTDSN
jgi:hypothetical protein